MSTYSWTVTDTSEDLGMAALTDPPVAEGTGSVLPDVWREAIEGVAVAARAARTTYRLRPGDLVDPDGTGSLTFVMGNGASLTATVTRD